MKIMLFMGNGCVVDSSGGAEKVLCNMANAMVERGHQVAVACNDVKSGKPFYPLHDAVDFINLDGTGQRKEYPQYKKIYRELTRPLRNTFLFRKFIEPITWIKIKDAALKVQSLLKEINPDIVLPFFIEDLLSLTYRVEHFPIPIILTLHGAPEMEFVRKSQIHLMRQALMKCSVLQLLMPNFEKVVKKNLSVKTVVIPNAVNIVDDHAMADLLKPKNEYIITTLARLEHYKQPHFLINAFSQISQEYPQWKVHFYGKETRKDYREFLERLIRQKRLSGQVFLKGPTDNPLSILKQCDIFAFPSKYEGFGLALVEAMTVGLPCIGLKTTPAVNELIIEGKNGFLAENNEKDFAAKLKILMDDQELRSGMGKNGHEFAKQFAPSLIWDQWENLLLETIHRFYNTTEIAP